MELLPANFSSLLQDAAACKNENLITRHHQSQEKVSYYRILDALKVSI